MERESEKEAVQKEAVILMKEGCRPLEREEGNDYFDYFELHRDSCGPRII